MALTETKENSSIIDVSEVTKTFRRYSDRPQSLKTFLVNSAKGKFRPKSSSDITVLDGISFSIQQGEFVGIMGRNGVGKSTLLKLITGIYLPSKGKITVSGTIAPLIELGAGFNPELSGYENIFLNSAVMGFGREATQAALRDILNFADLGELIDAPVRTYSSGMVVRLGFAIATHLPAPILLVDEILAVGDKGFQEKCLKRIHQLHKEKRTIVLITHNPQAVANNCTRCIVIDRKNKVFDGNPAEGASFYGAMFG